MEAVTPRVHERMARIIPEVEARVNHIPKGRWTGKPWLIVGAAIAAVLTGVTVWRVLHTAEPAPERAETTAPEARPVQIEPSTTTPPGSPSAPPL